MRSLVGGGAERGLGDSVSRSSASLRHTHHSGFILSPFHQGESSGGGDSGFSQQGSGGACASFSGVLQPHVHGNEGVRRLEGWRPIIDLSTLNLPVIVSKFRVETAQSVLHLVLRRMTGWRLDLKDAYLQIPIHPRSRKFLRFTAGGRACQFKVLCFGLSIAPQVFTWVMAPVAGFLHRLGVRMLKYLDDWLITASSREEACLARDMVLQLCRELGIVFNLEK